MIHLLGSILAFIAGFMFGAGAILGSFKNKLKDGYTPELIGEDDSLNWKKEATE